MKQYAEISDLRLNQLMYLSTIPHRSWQPAHFLDIRYDWPEDYQKVYGQPFSSFYFAKNCSAVLGYVQANGIDDKVARMSEYLHFVARQYTIKEHEQLYIVNDFNFPFIQSTLLRGFRGAFMNAYTAYGYLHLYEAIGNQFYLDRAQALLSTYGKASGNGLQLSGADEHGDFWFNEYVFQVPSEDVELFVAMGFRRRPDEFFRANVYNGHIHALLALVKYAKVAGSDEFMSKIQLAVETMRRQLPLQLYEEQYFSYMSQLRPYPDYGQARAVTLARGLAELVPKDSLLQSTAASMQIAYEKLISGREKYLYERAIADLRRMVENWRKGETNQSFSIRASDG